MSLGLALLLIEALTVYGLVFLVHAIRDRFTLLPYYGLLGVLAATLRWTTDAGIEYEVGPLTLILGSVVFFTSILFGVFLLYLFDGVKAAQIGIYTVVAVSILSPAVANIFYFQLTETDPAEAERIVLSPARVYVASTAAMVIDFLCMSMVWEFLGRRWSRLPYLFRIATCLLTAYWLDALLFSFGAFWGDPDFGGILTGNLISRAVLTVCVAPIVTLYVVWESRRHHYQITPRRVMALLHQSAQTELDLSDARHEIEVRKRIENELRRRDAILRSLAYTAEHYLNGGRDAIGMAELLMTLGNALGVSRGCICENDVGPGGERLVKERFTWISPASSIAQRRTSWEGTAYGAAGLGRWERLLSGGELVAGLVRDFPPVEQPVLISRGVLSILVLPVVVQEAWWGFLAFEDCETHRVWPRSELDALRTAAGTLGAAIHQRRIEEALLATNQRLDLALEGGDLGLWDWDIVADQVVFNEQWARMLGYTLKDLEPTTRAWQKLIHPDDKVRLRERMLAHLKGETASYDVEVRMRNRSGDWHWILSKGKVVSRDANGWALRATGTHLDVTLRKETEEALRLSQELFRLMYEESPLGLALCAMDGTFVQANRAYLKIVDYTEEEIRKLRYLDITPAGYAALEEVQIETMRSTGRYGPYEKLYIRKSGDLVPVLLNGCLVEGADGNEYVWSIVEDISVRKAAEQAIAEARAYEREIETRIEETLLRGRPPAHLEGVEIAAITVPNQHLDGDFAEFIPLNPRCFDVLVGDVMGKGIFAALVSAGAKSRFLRALASQLASAPGARHPSPVDLVAAVHRDITRQLIELDCFLTLCYARFDLDAGRVTYVDCGHTKTIRYRPGNNTCLLLEGTNVPIGFLEAEDYEEHETDLQPGDLFIFYSDGLTETRNREGAMFGVDRLQETIRIHASLDPIDLTHKVVELVGQFSGLDAPGDDQTCVTVRIQEPCADSRTVKARLTIYAVPEQLVVARTFIQEHLAAHAALLGGEEDFSRVVLAFVEALSNIIKHSFGGGAEKSIEIELRSSRNRLSIDITHGGTPFRPRSTPLPDPKQRREGGYGLYIMNRCFDQIAYESTGTGSQCISLLKLFSPAWRVPSPPAPQDGGCGDGGGGMA